MLDTFSGMPVISNTKVEKFGGELQLNTASLGLSNVLGETVLVPPVGSGRRRALLEEQINAATSMKTYSVDVSMRTIIIPPLQADTSGSRRWWYTGNYSADQEALPSRPADMDIGPANRKRVRRSMFMSVTQEYVYLISSSSKLYSMTMVSTPKQWGIVFDGSSYSQLGLSSILACTSTMNTSVSDNGYKGLVACAFANSEGRVGMVGLAIPGAGGQHPVFPLWNTPKGTPLQASPSAGSFWPTELVPIPIHSAGPLPSGVTDMVLGVPRAAAGGGPCLARLVLHPSIPFTLDYCLIMFLEQDQDGAETGPQPGWKLQLAVLFRHKYIHPGQGQWSS